jgi:hypothetical protein
MVVKCLVIDAKDALSDRDTAIALLRDWMRFVDQDYYRIHAPASRYRLYYDVREQKGVYWTMDQGDVLLDFGPITPSSTDWDTTLLQIQALAAQVDAQLVFPSARDEARIEGTSAAKGKR